MSTEQYNSRRLQSLGIKIDKRAGFIAAVMLAIQYSSLKLALRATSTATQEPAQSTNPIDGGLLVALIIVESLAIAGVYLAYKRLPERWRTYLKKTLLALFFILAVGFATASAYLAYEAGELATSLPLALLGGASTYVGGKLIVRYQLSWIIHNLAGIVLGIAITTAISLQFGPAAIIVILCLAIVWDYIAVDLSGIMSALISASSAARLPNYLVIPNAVQLDLTAVRDALTDDTGKMPTPDGVAGVIGVGDFALPSMLPVAAAVSTGVPDSAPVICGFAGAIAAIPVLRGASARRDGALPALPWLNSGAILGYVAGVLISPFPISTALGGVIA